ncbi:unnamed protein product, partial [Clonostachys rosea]
QHVTKRVEFADQIPRYRRSLSRAPLTTQCITTAILFATGDVIAQQLVEKRGVEKHDVSRTGRMFLYVVFGPAATQWYKFLSRRIVIQNRAVQLVCRVMCDQVVFAPISNAAFLTSMALLEGTSPREKLSKNYWAALKMNYMIWPAVQTVNFSFVPLQYQLLFVNGVSVGWNTFLSLLNGSRKSLE